MVCSCRAGGTGAGCLGVGAGWKPERFDTGTVGSVRAGGVGSVLPTG